MEFGSKIQQSIEMMVWTDNQGHKTDKTVKDYLKQHKEVGEFRIELRLNGFIPAGTKAFNIWKDLSIVSSTYNYTIGFDRNQQNTIFGKTLPPIARQKRI